MTVSCYAFSCFKKYKGFNSCFLMFIFLICLLVSSALVEAAPHKSKNKKYDGVHIVYDRKQTGDFNLQVQLKDFQIIALLGDDVLGDYDYNYDYSDFTIKPTDSTTTSTTPKPTSSSPPPSTTQKEPRSTSQLPIHSSSESEEIPNDPILADIESSSQELPGGTVSHTHPYPIEVIASQPTKKPGEDQQSIRRKVVLLDEDTHHNSPAVGDISSSQEVTLETTLSLVSNSNKHISKTSSDSPVKPSDSPPSFPEPSLIPESAAGKIKVQILEAPSSTKSGSHSIGIVPGEELKGETNGLHSEISSYRKCSTGFLRDKRGRCRRVRRPGNPTQIPFGFSRLASNLASRLRLPPHGNPKVTSRSIE